MDVQAPVGDSGSPLGGGGDGESGGNQQNGGDGGGGGGGGDMNPGEPQSPQERKSTRPRVRGELGWRERAEEAERRLDAIESELESARSSLASAEGALEASERARAIDAALVASDAIDLDTARLLVEREMRTSESADAEAAVRAVREAKPFLFGDADDEGEPSETPDGFGMHGMSATGSAASGGPGAGRPLAAMADEARSTGDRRLLLRYLRARRVAP
ncbi:MAG: hypothetical protein AAF297_01225 [Planctomycetota bacterium]